MASALAMMHWLGQIDGNDIEFVLAAPNPDFWDHSMWIFDFDCCKRMSMDIHRVNQAVAAFLRNDPYYGRTLAKKYGRSFGIIT
jgi:hypothetical protein